MSSNNIHSDEVALLIKTVLESPGVTSPGLRESIFHGKDIPGSLNVYAAKVHRESYKITEDDIRKLISEGCTEDEIFEVTVCAALGASKPELDRGLQALKESANEA